MYAVIEFERKECSVVPVLWLTEDQSKCYWPKNITMAVFELMVQSSEHPKPSWSKYKVVKLYNILDDYQEASAYLEKFLSENSTSSSTSENNESDTKQLTKKTVLIDDWENDSDSDQNEISEIIPPLKKYRENEPSTHKRNDGNLSQDLFRVSGGTDDISTKPQTLKSSWGKGQQPFHKSSSSPRISSPHATVNYGKPSSEKKTMPKSKTHKRCENNSPEEFSSEDDDVATLRVKSSRREEFLPQTPSSSPNVFSGQNPSPQNSLPSISSVRSSSTNCSQFEEPTNILTIILTQVEHIRAVQDQLCIKLDNIERNQQTSTIQQLQVPTAMPVLPISTKAGYKNLEVFLTEKSNALYMRRRLAAIGGSSVRSTVMNVLKFLLSNEVAMKFNWSGRDKRPFKDTAIMAVVNEAVKLSYSGREPPDLTDSTINNAVKDWLKLAKHRYLYSKKSMSGITSQRE